MPPAAASATRRKLLDAAVATFRAKGYAGTAVDDLCAAAGVTKGAFFHHFASKEALAVAAAAAFSDMAEALFGDAPFRTLPDPAARLLAYVAFRKAILQGALPDYTCLAGTLVQEAYATHPPIRDACNRTIRGHAATLVPDIEAALRARGLAGTISAESLALHTQAVIQGAFILAKASDGPQVAADCLDHLTRYLALLFATPAILQQEASPCPAPTT